MRISRYSTDITIDGEKGMLYNTLSREYYIYQNEERDQINSLIKEINKGTYTVKEIEIIKELLKKKIIIQDSMDEMVQLEFLENSSKYQDKTYKILVYATNACNFRCTYCEQKHEHKRLDDRVANSIVELVKKLVLKVHKIEIDWFGGEPLLEYKKIIDIMEQIKGICLQAGCELSSTMTTNGYLLSDSMIEKIATLNMDFIQITLDGNKGTHDKRRVLADGKGTFEQVLSNVKNALKRGIKVILRINIDTSEDTDITSLLEAIDEEYRNNVFVSISNIFQNEVVVSTFTLLKQAISMGYNILGRKNAYVHCHTCIRNSVAVDTDGSILLCSNTVEGEKRMGYLDESGNVHIERIADYYKIKTLSARDNPECRECIELPYCIGGCKYGRLDHNDKCIGRSGDGLIMEERALLDYYYDLEQRKRG